MQEVRNSSAGNWFKRVEVCNLQSLYFDKGFDQPAYVGVVLMGGIVVNRSIILVDHINHLRNFLPRRDAVARPVRSS